MPRSEKHAMRPAKRLRVDDISGLLSAATADFDFEAQFGAAFDPVRSFRFRNPDLEQSFLIQHTYERPEVPRTWCKVGVGLMLVFALSDPFLLPAYPDVVHMAARAIAIVYGAYFLYKLRHPPYNNLLRLWTGFFACFSVSIFVFQVNAYYHVDDHEANETELDRYNAREHLRGGFLNMFFIAVLVTGSMAALPLWFTRRFMVAAFLAWTLVLVVGLEDHTARTASRVIMSCIFMIAMSITSAIQEIRLRKEFFSLSIIEDNNEDMESTIQVFERILLNILPFSVATRVLAGESNIADLHADVSVCFVHFENVDKVVASMTATEAIRFTNDVITLLDQVCEASGAYKIKSIGLGFLAAAGLTPSAPDAHMHPAQMATFAINAIAEVHEFGLTRGIALSVKAGISTGPVVAGVVGATKLAFEIFGDTVNVASRMASNSRSGEVLVTEAVKARLVDASNTFAFAKRQAKVKGKGKVTAFVLSRTGEPSLNTTLVSGLDHLSLSEASSGFMSATIAESILETTPEMLDHFVSGQMVPRSFRFAHFSDANIEAQYRADVAEQLSVRFSRNVNRLLLIIAGTLLWDAAVWQRGDRQEITRAGLVLFRGVQLLLVALVAFLGSRSASPISRLRARTAAYTLYSAGFCMLSVMLSADHEARVTHLDALMGLSSFIVPSLVFLISDLPLTYALTPGILPLLTAIATFRPENTLGLLFSAMIAVICVVGSQRSGALRRRRFLVGLKMIEQNGKVQEVHQKAEGALARAFPQSVLAKLRDQRGDGGSNWTLVEGFPEAAILTVDIAGFTKLSGQVGPGELISFLNKLYAAFDEAAARFPGLESVKTLGDAWICAAGVPEPHPDYVDSVARLALEICEIAERTRSAAEAPWNTVGVRVGIACGPVFSGIVGRLRLAWDVFGPVVDESEQLQAQGEVGRVHLGASAADLVQAAKFAVETDDGGRMFLVGGGGVNVS